MRALGWAVLVLGATALAQSPAPTPEECDAGDGNACRALGMQALNAQPKDTEGAIRYLKKACSFGVNAACGEVDTLIDTSPPPLPPPDQPPSPRPPSNTVPQGGARYDDELRTDAPWEGSRFGVAGRLAGAVTFLGTGSVGLGSVLGGAGVRYSLRERHPDRGTYGPAVAVLLNGQFGGGDTEPFWSVGAEGRFEFVCVAPGDLLQPFFNVWVSAGVNAWYDRDRGYAPSVWAGVGLGWNVFALRRFLPRNAGEGGGSWIGWDPGPGLVFASIFGVILGMIHGEARIEQTASGRTAYHVIVGIGL
ncbi:MAG: hypothetical protein QM723_03870 [Myxococcaceae bacterium]